MASKGGFTSTAGKFFSKPAKSPKPETALVMEQKAQGDTVQEETSPESALKAELSPKRRRKAKVPEGMKVNPAYIEKRTQRLQLVLQPSLFARVKAAAQEQGVSVNDLVHTLLEANIKDKG